MKSPSFSNTSGNPVNKGELANNAGQAEQGEQQQR